MMKYISKLTLDTLLDHRSCRRYSDRKIAKETLDLILKAGFQASSSNYLQCVSAIRVTDPHLRMSIQKYSYNQTYIGSCAEFILFCIDFSIHKKIMGKAPTPETELFIMGLSDVAIVAQSVLVAAESLGIGAVLLSSFRSHINEVSELLCLPPHTAPILGICLGYPDKHVPQKTRLPLDLCVHHNTYQQKNRDDFADYSRELNEYYGRRGLHHIDFITNIENKLQEDSYNNNVLHYLNKQGFLIK